MEERIAIGYVARAKGVRGEVKVENLSHCADRFEGLEVVVLQKEERPDRRLRIESWRRHSPGLLMKFAGIDTPEEAREILVGGYLTVARDEVAPLPEDMYYVFELVGCRVEDEQGRFLGRLVEVLPMPSTDVYVVRSGEGEVLVPAVGDFVVQISIAQRRLVVRDLEALRA